jgi:hypothetical protein
VRLRAGAMMRVEGRSEMRFALRVCEMPSRVRLLFCYNPARMAQASKESFARLRSMAMRNVSSGTIYYDESADVY